MTELVKTALMITAFVSVMMLLIEYLNVLSAGEWQQKLAGHQGGQYVLAALLGVSPGCLGAFAAVAMYSHGVLTLGAVVTTMIATSGDEAFVILAMIPDRAPAVMGILFGLGILAGFLVDKVMGSPRTRERAACLEIHEQDRDECFPKGRILTQWKDCSPVRGTLALTLLLFLAALAAGQLGPPDWDWIRISLVAVSALALAIVATVPDHFLEDHLWRHVIRTHGPRIFLWTLGALIVLHLLTDVLQLEESIARGKWMLLVAACLVGLIPESGPHLVFVTMFAQGLIPLSVLLASSVVQDGHGMLPMLAHSRRDFLMVKSINFGAGLALGAIALGLGY